MVKEALKILKIELNDIYGSLDDLRLEGFNRLRKRNEIELIVSFLMYVDQKERSIINASIINSNYERVYKKCLINTDLEIVKSIEIYEK